ncbi:MAG: DUF4923 family protein [Prevotella sp.]|nr:DUF4923 family protein [Prevotella sp.]
MKKLTMIVCTVVSFLLTGCTGTTGNIFSGIDGASTIGNILTSVLGINQVTQESLIGTWKYYQPGCGFASDNLLAKAGGEVAAAKIKSELASTYQTMGIKSSNTYFTFNQDNSFSGKMMGTPLSGSYVYDPSTGQITLKTVLASINGFINTSGSGISLLFESKKLLTILQLVGSASGNATLGTISELSKNYDGVRLGFDLAR